MSLTPPHSNKEFSVLPWFGGKNLTNSNGVGKWVFSLLPPPTAGQTYAEPYAGMLGILLAREPVSMEIINDADSRVTRFWSTMRDEPDELKRLLDNTPYGRETYIEACAVLEADKAGDTSISEVRVVWAFVVAVGQGVMGKLNAHGWKRSRGFKLSTMTPDTSRATIFRNQVFRLFADGLRERIRDIVVECGDGAALAAWITENPYSVCYCDPPYAAGAYGYEEKSCAYELMDAVKEAKGLVAISGYPDDPFDDLGWMRHEKDTTIIIAQAPNGQRTECLWTNYDPADYIQPPDSQQTFWE